MHRFNIIPLLCWIPALVFWPLVLLDENDETQRLAPKYEAEVEARLWDGTRVDLLSESHAIEVDWSRKWAEAIGQALYYAELTGKKPGIILLVRDATKERRFIYRCQTVCAKYDIDLFIEQVEELPPAPVIEGLNE